MFLYNYNEPKLIYVPNWQLILGSESNMRLDNVEQVLGSKIFTYILIHSHMTKKHPFNYWETLQLLRTLQLG